MLHDFEAHVRSSVCHVFSTMLHYELQPVVTSACNFKDVPHVAACVGFNGDLNGVVYLYTTEVLGRHMVSRFLGLPQSARECEEMVCDVMGEITNMIVGPIKSRLADGGISCVLSVPSIVRGTNFTIGTAGEAVHQFFGYHCADGKVTIEVVIKKP